MKKILITGAGSYIGTSFETYLRQWPEAYQVDTMDLQEETWQQTSFSGYDSILHVVGLAHTRENKHNKESFYRINRDLTLEVARKAKADGVRQFVFLSSMSVYGINRGPINPNAEPKPVSYYGESKLQAEKGLLQLRGDNFSVVILRPPIIYGYGCHGNFRHMIRLAKIVPFFAAYENKRSMLSIENLTALVKDLMDTGADGIFCPQDPEYVCTCRMIQKLASEMGREIRLYRWLNPAVALAKHCTGAGRKAFSDLYYEREP